MKHICVSEASAQHLVACVDSGIRINSKISVIFYQHLSYVKVIFCLHQVQDIDPLNLANVGTQYFHLNGYLPYKKHHITFLYHYFSVKMCPHTTNTLQIFYKAILLTGLSTSKFFHNYTLLNSVGWLRDNGALSVFIK